MRLILIIAAVLVASCKPQPTELREGDPIDLRTPQAAEQCRAQPELDWCRP